MGLLDLTITTSLYHYQSNQNVNERAPRRKVTTAQEIQIEGFSSLLCNLSIGSVYNWNQLHLGPTPSATTTSLYDLADVLTDDQTAAVKYEPNTFSMKLKDDILVCLWEYVTFATDSNDKRVRHSVEIATTLLQLNEVASDNDRAAKIQQTKLALDRFADEILKAVEASLHTISSTTNDKLGVMKSNPTYDMLLTAYTAKLFANKVAEFPTWAVYCLAAKRDIPMETLIHLMTQHLAVPAPVLSAYRNPPKSVLTKLTPRARTSVASPSTSGEVSEDLRVEEAPTAIVLYGLAGRPFNNRLNAFSSLRPENRPALALDPTVLKFEA